MTNELSEPGNQHVEFAADFGPDKEIDDSCDVRQMVPKEIIEAKLSVMREAHKVDKTGRNEHFGFDYSSSFDVLTVIQPLMSKHGLCLEMWPERVDGPDGNGNMRVRFSMQWQHESGVVAQPIPWYGVSQDRDRQGRVGDKWFNKAATVAEKYFLLKQFHIPSAKEDDPDSGNPEPPAVGEQPSANWKNVSFDGQGPSKSQPSPEPWKEFARALREEIIKAESAEEIDRIIHANTKVLIDIKRQSTEGYDYLMKEAQENQFKFLQAG